LIVGIWGISDSISLPYPILDSLAAKDCAILLATEAALSVLGLVSNLMNKQARRARQRNWDIHIPLRLIIVMSLVITGYHIVPIFSSTKFLQF